MIAGGGVWRSVWGVGVAAVLAGSVYVYLHCWCRVVEERS